MNDSTLQNRSVIGIMSGTSLDGMDLACCTFARDEQGKWQYGIEAAACIPYSATWHKRLTDAPELTGQKLLQLHRDYGRLIGEQTLAFINENGLRPGLIASHGHTVFHAPASAFNFQAGDGAAIYAATGVPVVCDFRSVDICLGGQGAPLVPIGDALLFGAFDYCLNLGGIANISYQENGRRIAYDICGCNLLLDMIAKETGKEYDENGAMASKGHIDMSLLQKLNRWSYLAQQPPKSLDKQAMLRELLPLLEQNSIPPINRMATVAEHIALQISKAAGRASGKMLVTGGGAFNSHLLHLIEDKCSVAVIRPDEKLVKFKEALVFAFLGLLRVLGETNTLATVTGGQHDSIGGAVYGILQSPPHHAIRRAL